MKNKNSFRSVPMGHQGLSVLITALLAVGPTVSPSLSYAAGIIGTPGAGARVQITPVVITGWANAIGSFFNSPTSDLSTLSSVLPHLSQLDLNDPAVRASIEPVTRQIQAAAAAILSASASSLKEAVAKSQEPTGDTLEKMEILNTVFRDHLSESQRSQAQEVSQFHHSLLAEGNRAKLDAKIQSIAESWKRPLENGVMRAELPVTIDSSVKQKDVPNSKLKPANEVKFNGQIFPSVEFVENGVKGGDVPVNASNLSLGARLIKAYGRVAGFLRGYSQVSIREREAAFVIRHGETLRAVPGVVSVDAISYPVHYGTNYAVKVEVLPTADLAPVQKALAAYLYAGVEIRVESRGWKVYEISDNGYAYTNHMPPLDQRMALSLKRLHSDTVRTQRFVTLYGQTLRAVPGVVSVDAISSPVHYGTNYAVKVEVLPTADLAAVQKALDAYLYAGVKIRVESHGWEVYEISDNGQAYTNHMPPLDQRMDLSLKGL